MKETIEISIPKELLDKAKERKIDLDRFKNTVKAFAIIDITARTSKLSRKEAEVLSKKIKASAWKKLKKELKL
jgi:hypothetical protein